MPNKKREKSHFLNNNSLQNKQPRIYSEVTINFLFALRIWSGNED